MREKDGLRERVRRSRRMEPDAIRQERRAALARAAPALLPTARGGCAGYQPTRSEPDISWLLRHLHAAASVFLPRVAGAGLEWVAATADQLTGDHTGIPEPGGMALATGSAVVTELGATLILVPALAIDPATGVRLGYGGGFYDRLLATVPAGLAAVVGVCRGQDLMPLPAEPHDQPVGAILTEAGLRTVG